MQDSILIIDEAQSQREIAVLLCSLRFPSFNVVEVSNALEFAREIAARPYRLVIIDPEVAWADYWSLLEMVIATADSRTVLVYSRKDSAMVASRAIHLGAMDYVLKGESGILDLNRSILRFHSATLTPVPEAPGQVDPLQVDEASVIRHDIEEPLESVLTCLDLVRTHQGDRLDDASEALIQTAEVAAREMLERIRRDLARASAGLGEGVFGGVGSTLEDETCDPYEVFGTTIQSVSGLIRRTKGTVTHGVLPPVAVSQQDLHLIFQILISNALKYTADADPVVRVEAQPVEGGRVRFSVSDNGPGIPEEERDRVFDAFFRGAASKGLPGSGIGLNTCKATVERSGGRIWIDENAQTGTVFLFDLPAASPEKPDAEDAPPEPAHADEAVEEMPKESTDGSE